MFNLRYKRDNYRVSDREAMDVEHIVDVFRDNGYIIQFYDAYDAWADYSADLCAGWIMLPESDDELFRILYPRFEELEA